jgi:hypothetical protein
MTLPLQERQTPANNAYNTDMPDVETQSPSKTTQWIGKGLAVLLTVAIVVVVFWQSHPNGDGPNSNDPPGPPNFNNVPGDIEELGPSMWRVSAGPAVVMVNGNPPTFDYRLRLFMLIDDDTRTMVRSYRQLTIDPNAAKSIGLTDEQMQRLQAINLPRMVISDDDQAKFEKIWHAYEEAVESQKSKARDDVLATLRQIGTQSIEPTKKAWTDVADTVKKTLTLDQMAKLAVYQQTNGSPGFGAMWGNRGATQPR